MKEKDYSRYLTAGDSSVDRLLKLGSLIPADAGRFCVYALRFIEEIVYVGYTERLKERIAEHRRGWLGRIDMFDGYTFAPFKTIFEALDFERRMILALDPMWNKQKHDIDMRGRPL